MKVKVIFVYPPWICLVSSGMQLVTMHGTYYLDQDADKS
jgi:hypothetical protein